MSSVGPSLPPHLLAKRKRSTGPETDSDSGQSPGPQLSQSRSSSPDNSDKRRRIIGPSLPPAPLNERPHKEPMGLNDHQEGSESSDDEGLGPALPPGPGSSVCSSNTLLKCLELTDIAIYESSIAQGNFRLDPRHT